MLYPYFLSLFFLYLNSSLTVHLSIYVSSVPIHQSLPLCVFTSLSLSCIPIFLSHIASIHLCIQCTHTSVSPSLCIYLSLSILYPYILVSYCIYPSMYPVYLYISLSLSVYIPPSLYLISLYSCLTLHLSIYVSHTHTSLCTSLPLSLTHPHTQTHVVFMCKCICVRSRRGINRIMYGAASRKGNSNPFIFDQFWGSPFKL